MTSQAGIDPTILGTQLAAALGQFADELVTRAVEDLDLPRRDASAEVETTRRLLQRLAELVPSLEGRRPLCEPGQAIALLLPYNITAGALWDVACLLAPGNRVRIRFSERSTRVAAGVENVLAEAAPGLVTVERAHRESFLDDALDNPEVPLLVAYGGDGLARALMRRRSPRSGQRLLFEGPGKDPMIVGPGADVALVADVVRDSKLAYSGQQCVATEILLVHESLFAEVRDAVHDRFDSAPVGDPDDEATVVGPLGSEDVPRRIDAQIRQAVAAGARIETGGRVDGRLVYPTLLSGIEPSMAIWQEETFGPVLGMASFVDVDEAIELARRSRYGLSCIACGPDSAAIKDALLGADYAEPVPDLRYGVFGTVLMERPRFSELDDFVLGWGGYGASGWIMDEDGLRQGPTSLAREASRSEESTGERRRR